MESNDELKEVNIKSRACYYFGDIIIFQEFDLDNISVDKKSYKNILVYKILYKTLIGAEPLRIRFDKIDGFIRVYNGTTYLELFGAENMISFTA